MINIAVVRLGYMSNYTDFDFIERRKGVNLFYTRDKKHLDQADAIILPGTKNDVQRKER